MRVAELALQLYIVGPGRCFRRADGARVNGGPRYNSLLKLGSNPLGLPQASE